MIQDVAQFLVTGLLNGGSLALLTAGLALIFGVMKVINFAQGEFVMLGMYFVFFLSGGTATGDFGLALAAFPVFVGVGYGLHRFVVKHVSGVKFAGASGHDAQLILTLGIALIIQNAVLMVIGSRPRLTQTVFDAGAWDIGGVVIGKARMMGAGIAIVVILCLLWALARTRSGRILRATSDDPEAAIYMGVDVDGAHAWAFGIGVGLAAVGGGILASFYAISPFVGLDFIILMFVAIVLGGLGSIAGALVGAFIIGLGQALAAEVLPLQLQSLVVFAVFLLTLYVRPQGLFGKADRI